MYFNLQLMFTFFFHNRAERKVCGVISKCLNWFDKPSQMQTHSIKQRLPISVRDLQLINECLCRVVKGSG